MPPYPPPPVAAAPPNARCCRAFHQDCADPPVTEDELQADPEQPWYCRQCSCLQVSTWVVCSPPPPPPYPDRIGAGTGQGQRAYPRGLGQESRAVKHPPHDPQGPPCLSVCVCVCVCVCVQGGGGGGHAVSHSARAFSVCVVRLGPTLPPPLPLW